MSRRPPSAPIAANPVADGTAMQRPLVIDVAGTALTAADRRRLAHPGVGGVIHFARNWRDRAQLRALNAEIKAIRPDLLVSVDHEGGRVQRFRTDGFTRLPSMRALGTLWMEDPMRAVEAATAAGHVDHEGPLGRRLETHGVGSVFGFCSTTTKLAA